MICEIYKSYLSEFEREFGNTTKAMSFERFCEFYDVDEHTSDEELRLIFGA